MVLAEFNWWIGGKKKNIKNLQVINDQLKARNEGQ